MPMKDKVISFLNEAGIPFRITEHPAVYTMADMQALELQRLGTIPKNLFIKDGKGKRHFIVTACMDTQIDLKALSEKLDAKKLGLASAERLEKYLGVSAGCVSPLGVINDRENAVTVIFDSKLQGLDRLGVHPNVHDATLWLSFGDLKRAVELAGNEAQILDL